MPEVDAETRRMLWKVVKAPDNSDRSQWEEIPEVQPRRKAPRERFTPDGLVKKITEDRKLAEKVIPWLLKMSRRGITGRMSEVIRDTSGTRALRVLYRLGEKVHPYCREALLEPSPLKGVEPECAALLRSRPDILTEVLAKGPVAAKVAAAEQLCRQSEPGLEAARAAADALEIDNDRLRYAACYLLTRAGKAPEGTARKLEKLIDSDNVSLAQVAMEAFAVLAGPRSTLPLMRRYAGAGNHNQIRQAVLIALGRSGDPMAVEFLVARLSDGEDMTRAYATRALGDIGSGAAVPALMAMAGGDGHEWLRAGALEALGRIGDPRALDLLDRSLDAQSDRIRLVAIEAMGQMGNSECIAPLEEVLNAPGTQSGFRIHAVQALGKIRHPRAAWVLIDYLQEQGRFFPAFESLKQITGQDFGADIDAWVQYRRDFQTAVQEAGRS
jgi:HEAT repeat protein